MEQFVQRIASELVGNPLNKDSKPIPFVLLTKTGDMLIAIGQDKLRGIFLSPYFILNKYIKEYCCAELTILEPVGIDGCPVDHLENFYSIKKTEHCIVVSLKNFTAFQTFSSNYVDRPTINLCEDK